MMVAADRGENLSTRCAFAELIASPAAQQRRRWSQRREKPGEQLAL
jgi:hypothetical protein